MSADVLILALVVGLANYAFRYGPTRIGVAALPADGWLARALAAIGPAAIATLCVASLMPAIPAAGAAPLPLLLGLGAVLGLWATTRSVALATLGGAAVHALTFALTA